MLLFSQSQTHAHTDIINAISMYIDGHNGKQYIYIYIYIYINIYIMNAINMDILDLNGGIFHCLIKL